MKEIIKLGAEGKVFSLSAVADLFYGKVETITTDINWDKKCLIRKLIWTTHDFVDISDEDRNELIKMLVEAGKTEELQTRILCYLRKKMTTPSLVTRYYSVERPYQYGAIALEIIRWHVSGVPAVEGEKAMVRKLLATAKEEKDVQLGRICVAWLDILSKK